MERDKNLLFGVFAVQLRKITPAQLAAAAGAWAADPSSDLAARLVEDGAIVAADRVFVQRLVDEAVRAHDGDPEATLAAVGGREQVYQSFAGSVIVTDSGNVESGVANDELDDTIPGVPEAPGRYSTHSEYARGGMGRVLLVHDEHLGRDIALKELLPHLYGKDTDSGEPTPVRKTMPMVARFLQEARITGQLEHPGIVPVYELGHRADGSIYYTMKLVRGKTLSQAIKEADGLQGRLALLPHFIDLCNAIAYAHSRGVIHRDIKPGNVMVGEFGETVVLDWGLAKAKDRTDVHADGFAETLRAMNMGDEGAVAQTQYGHALGTPMYMPPEQARGQIDQIDERSDVYSLGAVLYELLCGVAPFDGASSKKILMCVIGQEPRNPADHAPAAPPELVAICQQSMAKDPSDRYISAKDLAADIERFQAGAMVGAHSYTPREVIIRFIRRYQVPLAAAAIALILIVLVTVAYTVRLSQANQRLEAARHESETAREHESIARRDAEESLRQVERATYVSKIRLAQNAIDENQIFRARKLLNETSPEYRNWEWGFLYRMLDTSAVTLPGRSTVDMVGDGSLLVTGSYGDTASVWDVVRGETVLTIAGHDGEVSSAKFSRDGGRIITASYDGTAIIWDSTTGDELLHLSGHGDAIMNACFSIDGSRALTVSLDRTAMVWDAESGIAIQTLSGHDGSLYGGGFSPDGSLVVTASFDNTAKIWDVESGDVIYTLSGHDGRLYSASFSPDGRDVVTTSSDGTAKVWNAENGEERFTLSGHNSLVTDAEFTRDGRQIITVSYDGTAIVWGAHTGAKTAQFAGHVDGILGVSCSNDGNSIVTVARDRTVKLWAKERDPAVRTLAGQDEIVHDAAFSNDGSRVATSAEDGSVKIWDSETGNEVIGFSAHDSVVRSVAFNHDSTRLLSASWDKSAKILDPSTGEILQAFTSDSSYLWCASWNSDSTRVVTGLDDSAVIWDVSTGTELLSLEGHAAPVLSASFANSDRWLVTASADSTVRVWDAENGEQIYVLEDHVGPVASASINRSGNRFVTASGDGTARVWDASAARTLYSLEGHAGAIFSASYNGDGTRIVTASDDHTAKVWDADTGSELLTISGHKNALSTATFGPNDTQLLTASMDGTAKIWHSAPWDLDAWQSDDFIGEISGLALRWAPRITEIEIERFTDRATSQMASIEDRIARWRRLDRDANVWRAIDGQGVLLLQDDAIHSFDQILFKKYDLLVRANGVRIRTLGDVAAALSATTSDWQAQTSNSARFTLNVVNGYDHQALHIMFPGTVDRELRISYDRALELFSNAVRVANQNMESLGIQDGDLKKRALNINEMAGSLGLDQSDILVSINQVEIDSYTSLLKVLHGAKKDLVQKGKATIELIVKRRSTNEYIRNSLIVD